MGLTIGMDLGSSSLKLMLIDDYGNIVSQCSKEYFASSYKSGWSEIDPAIWYDKTIEGLKELLDGFDGNKVTSIGITGQMHTTVFLDENGESVRPAIMWNDTRTRDLVPELKELYLERSEYLNANIISTGSPAANLYWLKTSEPENYSRLHKFLIGYGYLVYRFTGKFVTDYSGASTSSLFDWENYTWSKTVGDILGLEDEIYPEILGSAVEAGKILPEISKEIGLNKNVRVIAGAGDNPASAISAGCFTSNNLLLSLGTSGVVIFPKSNINLDAKGKNIVFSEDGINFQFLTQGAVQSCGSGIDWWFRDILQTDYHYESDYKMNDTLIFYPHLTGDKTIENNPFLRGAFVGLGTDTTRKDMTQAVFEGISFAIRHLIEEMNINISDFSNLLVTGGGANNPFWMQILADILDFNIVKPKKQISAVYGVCLLASDSYCSESNLHNVNAANDVMYMPNKSNTAIYNKKYEQYLLVHNLMNRIYGIKY